MSLSKDKRYKNDIILIISVLILGVLLIVIGNRKNEGDFARVMDSNGTVYTFDLSVNTELRVETELGYNVVCVTDGKICVKDADCPDCSCVKQGEINRKGDKIVCLPHKLIVEVDSDDKSELDSITY